MVQYLLLAGQLLVVILVYLFVWRVIRSAHSDLKRPMQSTPTAGGAAFPQESTILAPADVRAARAAAGMTEPRLVVEASDVLRTGIPFTIGGGLSIGRIEGNDIVLDEQTVSSRHARVVAPSTIVDEGSTNGTYVNGAAVASRASVRAGDRIQIGSTVFRYEDGRR